jgi:adenine-specific DNA methylase
LSIKESHQAENFSGRSFIEETFPIEEVSIESAREKSIRQGHSSTLHIWWARRPLSSTRATAYAALIPNIKNNNVEEHIQKKRFIIELSKWKNSQSQHHREGEARDYR